MEKTLRRFLGAATLTAFGLAFAGPALADCSSLPNQAALRAALTASITPASGANGGLGFNSCDDRRQ